MASISEPQTQSSGKVLVILSEAETFPLHKSDGSVSQEDTGVFLTELAKPLGQILDAGYDVVVRPLSSRLCLSYTKLT